MTSDMGTLHVWQKHSLCIYMSLLALGFTQDEIFWQIAIEASERKACWFCMIRKNREGPILFAYAVALIEDIHVERRPGSSVDDDVHQAWSSASTIYNAASQTERDALYLNNPYVDRLNLAAVLTLKGFGHRFAKDAV